MVDFKKQAWAMRGSFSETAQVLGKPYCKHKVDYISLDPSAIFKEIRLIACDDQSFRVIVSIDEDATPSKVNTVLSELVNAGFRYACVFDQESGRILLKSNDLQWIGLFLNVLARAQSDMREVIGYISKDVSAKFDSNYTAACWVPCGDFSHNNVYIPNVKHEIQYINSRADSAIASIKLVQYHDKALQVVVSLEEGAYFTKIDKISEQLAKAGFAPSYVVQEDFTSLGLMSNDPLWLGMFLNSISDLQSDMSEVIQHISRDLSVTFDKNYVAPLWVECGDFDYEFLDDPDCAQQVGYANTKQSMLSSINVSKYKNDSLQVLALLKNDSCVNGIAKKLLDAKLPEIELLNGAQGSIVLKFVSKDPQEIIAFFDILALDVHTDAALLLPKIKKALDLVKNKKICTPGL